MRTVGATAMNATSSRSHSIFTIVVEMNDVDDAGKDHIRVGKVMSRFGSRCGELGLIARLTVGVHHHRRSFR